MSFAIDMWRSNLCLLERRVQVTTYDFINLIIKGVIHETQIFCKSLTKRQIQCFNNISCHGFEFAIPYRALPGFVNDPLSC
jgi:hypothetical protein